jgi:hypothetical protein
MILVNGKMLKIISEKRIAIHPDPLPKKAGEKVAKMPEQRYYIAILTESTNEKA